jgi:hypothetical protein
MEGNAMVASARLPEEGARSFACPLCGVVSQQDWDELSCSIDIEPSPHLCQCEECEGVSLWFNGAMLVPATGGVKAPSKDLPEAVRATYNEARAVFVHSRRAAAALLRLAVEQLCVELNGVGPTLNQHIGVLVGKGLHQQTADMFDAVRLVGNNAIHPIDRIGLDEKREIVEKLFFLVNEIADEVITKPRQRAEATAWIPDEERERMAKRDEGAIAQHQKANQGSASAEAWAQEDDIEPMVERLREAREARDK